MKETEQFDNLSIFTDFNDSELNSIRKYFVLKKYKKNEIIKIDDSKELDIIISGRITSTHALPGNIARKSVEYRSGDVFGEMSLFGYRSPFDTYHAQEESRILSIHEKDIIDLIENSSEIAIKFIAHIISLTIRKLRESSNFLADVVQWGENASRRVITDELTGIYNRSFLEDAIENFFNISKSNNKPLALLMIDIDNFRVINDTLGQEAGNIVLQETVNLIKETISKYGIIARYGGDEFSILLPETDLNKALEIAEQIRKAVEDYNYNSGKSIPVAISIGISAFPDTALDIDTFKEKADAALYKAKESGRNRVAYIE
jgi:diguanylate cyclase (GGDEF)-like protein